MTGLITGWIECDLIGWVRCDDDETTFRVFWLYWVSVWFVMDVMIMWFWSCLWDDWTWFLSFSMWMMDWWCDDDFCVCACVWGWILFLWMMFDLIGFDWMTVSVDWCLLVVFVLFGSVVIACTWMFLFTFADNEIAIVFLTWWNWCCFFECWCDVDDVNVTELIVSSLLFFVNAWWTEKWLADSCFLICELRLTFCWLTFSWFLSTERMLERECGVWDEDIWICWGVSRWVLILCDLDDLDCDVDVWSWMIEMWWLWWWRWRCMWGNEVEKKNKRKQTKRKEK